ncbi:hypothetical protein Tco_0876404 [Tanacetum coccineum]|uniref:Uncharacterized protein n=1 Tax=Tanacetum coccineum TaxID=301880 RepID=A0ABQ5BVB5_9ASTR
MCTYLKNMAGFTHNQLKNKSFDEVQKAFDNTMNWIDTFVRMDSEVVKGSKDKAEGTDGSSRRYSSMIEMLRNFNRDDLETLWKLIKAKHGNTRPEEEYERVLYGDLKTMFEPDKRYPLIPATITDMLNKKLQTDHLNEMCYQLLKLMEKHLKKK